jgi:flagellar biosynthesis GTPase FlhF
MLDYGRWQTVLKHTRQKSKPSTVAVLVAMENVCFEQRSKHGGNAFVGSYPFLATMSGVHEDTVRNVVELLETLEVVKVKRNYDVRRKQYSENYYTLLLIGGGGGGGTIQGGVMESDVTAESVALSKEKGEASKCPPLPLRHLDASHKKDIDEALAAKREAAAKYKAEQLAAAEERMRQEEAELAERKERERIEREQRLERLKLAAEKEKADKEAAERAEDARRLAMRSDVGSCVAAIHTAAFDEYDPGTLVTVLGYYDRSTFNEAVGMLRGALSDKLRACIKNNEYVFD